MQDFDKIKIVIFDFDETLYSGGNWDNANAHFCKPLVRLGLFENTADAEKTLSKKYPEISDFYKKVIAFMEENGFEPKVFRDLLEHESVYDMVSDGLRKMNYDLLNELAKHYVLYIISDSPKIYVDYYLNFFGINRNVFKEVIINPFLTEDISKFPCMQKIVLDNNADVNEVLMIGDSQVADILPAKKLGIKFEHITSVEETENLVRHLIDTKNDGGKI